MLCQIARRNFSSLLVAGGGPSKTMELYLMVSCQIGIQKKVDIFNLFFPSIFNNADTHWATWFPETADHNCWTVTFSLWTRLLFHFSYCFSEFLRLRSHGKCQGGTTARIADLSIQGDIPGYRMSYPIYKLRGTGSEGPIAAEGQTGHLRVSDEF